MAAGNLGLELARSGFIVGRTIYPMNLTVADLAKQLAADVSGDASATLTGFAMIDRAKAGDLTFAETPEYFAAAEASATTAIICDQKAVSDKKILLRVANPRVAFAKAQAAAKPVEKTIHSAVANAEENFGLNRSDLYVSLLAAVWGRDLPLIEAFFRHVKMELGNADEFCGVSPAASPCAAGAAASRR